MKGFLCLLPLFFVEYVIYVLQHRSKIYTAKKRGCCAKGWHTMRIDQTMKAVEQVLLAEILIPWVRRNGVITAAASCLRHVFALENKGNDAHLIDTRMERRLRSLISYQNRTIPISYHCTSSKDCNWSCAFEHHSSESSVDDSVFITLSLLGTSFLVFFFAVVLVFCFLLFKPLLCLKWVVFYR